MSLYSTVEASILTLLQAYSGSYTFTTDNSARHDWSVLDTSTSDYAAVLSMAQASQYGDQLTGRGAQGKQQERHVIRLSLFYKRQQGLGGDGAAYSALLTMADAINVYLSQWPRINNTAGVKRMQLSEMTVPDPVAPSNAPATATHYATDLLLTVMCETALDVNESIY
jgi:hypothetical protein